MKSDDPIDRSVFSELQATMGADFVEELVDTFLDEAPGMLSDIKEAAAMGAHDRFRRAAHSIKSNAAIFGATDLTELARQLEITGLEADQDTSNAKLAALDAAYSRAAATLKELRRV